jgi:hypothetical protein
MIVDKKMKDNREENDAAKVLKKMTTQLRHLLKAEYDGIPVPMVRVSLSVGKEIAGALPCAEIDDCVRL